MIPKVELHCHLEGSIAPALARELAARNGLDPILWQHVHSWPAYILFAVAANA